MKVYKFGGASVKSASAVKNVCRIINQEPDELLVVISAMGKTTNALEEVVTDSSKNINVSEKLKTVTGFHSKIVRELFIDPAPTLKKLDGLFQLIVHELAKNNSIDIMYDQVVCFGEIISTTIVSDYFATNRQSTFIDARDYIITDSSFREAKVNWDLTNAKIRTLNDVMKSGPIITQGFIGRSENGLSTTLGREGSDFSAAIFASCLHAFSVTIWKDVPGVMSADPKRLPAATIFNELPYQEAAEMTYYGASVIHPKTIKPLANSNIPLLVKHFDDISLRGTRIHECKIDRIPPLIVFKDNQCLISCKVTDYAFVSEDQLSFIFKSLSDQGIKINMMQNSAISFSFCADYREAKIREVIETLSHTFEVYYNTNLTLITIKNYTPELSNEYRNKKGIVLEQLSRSTLQILIQENAVV
jgi:aspartate kinase